MDKYYLYVKAFVLFASLIAIAMVRANVVLPRRVQRLFTLAFAGIIVGSTSEFLTVWFDGAGTFARPIMCIAQALDYACALFAPIAVSAAFINEKSKYVRMAFIVAGVHAAVQLALSFSGLVFVVDGNAAFSRGPLYPLYIAMYSAVAIYVMRETMHYLTRLEMRVRYIPWLVLSFVAVAIIVNVIDTSVLMVWATLTVCGIFFDMLYCLFVQQTDALTCLFNRQSYTARLANLCDSVEIIFFDVDDFKSVNDKHGHDGGDECLVAVAKALYDVYGRDGNCFRIGGDEFSVILHRNMAGVDALEETFAKKIADLNAEHSWMTTVSIGHAHFEPGDDMRECVRRADVQMYERKRAAKPCASEGTAQVSK